MILQIKLTEIKLVGSIYKNAILTISASSASSVSEGFLTKSPYGRDFLFPFGPPSPRVQNYGKALVDSIKSVEKEALEKRAWALQESLLSPRLLIFGNRNISWRCQSEYATRDGAPNPHHTMGGADFCRRLPSAVFRTSKEVTAQEKKEQIGIWTRIVQDYSKKTLTLPGDRLVAIEVVAQELKKVWGDEYLAGLWKRCFIHHLLWKRDELSSGSSIPPEKAFWAPSWSWACVQDSISIPFLSEVRGELLYSWTQTSGAEDRFSQTCLGRVIISAVRLDASHTIGMPAEWLKIFWDDNGRPSHTTTSYIFILLGVKLDGNDTTGLVIQPMGEGVSKRVGLCHWNWNIARVPRRDGIKGVYTID